jgi:hypothetical protein
MTVKERKINVMETKREAEIYNNCKRNGVK